MLPTKYGMYLGFGLLILAAHTVIQERDRQRLSHGEGGSVLTLPALIELCVGTFLVLSSFSRTVGLKPVYTRPGDKVYAVSAPQAKTNFMVFNSRARAMMPS